MRENLQKQRLLIEYLLSSSDTYIRCKSIIEPSYFGPEFRRSVEFINQYYDKYNATPSVEQIKAETKNEFEIKTITKDQLKYCADEIEAFCKQRALEIAILASVDLIEKGEEEKWKAMIDNAMSISLEQDIGLEYYEDPATRLEEQSLTPLRTSTGWKTMDKELGGGLARTEMIMFCASSGVGKSMTLQNLAKNFVDRKFHVVYLSLELSQTLIAQRFDIFHTGIPSPEHRIKFQEITNILNKHVASHDLGSLIIKRMPSGTNARQIRAYLKEYELKKGHLPDLLVVDYLDLMNPNEKIDLTDAFAKDKLATEQLRDIGEEYNMFIATASQLNRGALEAEDVGQQHTAGGISKVNTVDWQLAIRFTDQMRISGEMQFKFLKARSSGATGKIISLAWDNDTLTISDNKDENEQLKEAIEDKKTSLKGLPERSKNLFDIMDI